MSPWPAVRAPAAAAAGLGRHGGRSRPPCSRGRTNSRRAETTSSRLRWPPVRRLARLRGGGLRRDRCRARIWHRGWRPNWASPLLTDVTGGGGRRRRHRGHTAGLRRARPSPAYGPSPRRPLLSIRPNVFAVRPIRPGEAADRRPWPPWMWTPRRRGYRVKGFEASAGAPLSMFPKPPSWSPAGRGMKGPEQLARSSPISGTRWARRRRSALHGPWWTRVGGRMRNRWGRPARP